MTFVHKFIFHDNSREIVIYQIPISNIIGICKKLELN